jgi:hypothetical protein
VLALAALVVVLFLVYRPALRGAFVWDDLDFVVDTSWFDAPDGLRQIWLDPSSTSQYYPLTYSSHWLENRVFGRETTGYHLVNVLLHAANALLLWRVLRRLAVPGALLAAALFALHPVHVESVAWISERKNVLSGLFFLSALLAWLRCSAPDEEPPRVRPGWYALCVALYVAALLSKSVTCALPAVILLLVWWKRGRVPAAELRALLPLFVVGVGFALLTVWLERNQVGASGLEFQLAALDRVTIAGRALWFYAGKLIWPEPLIFIYPRWPTASAQPWQLIFPTAFVLAVGVLWWQRVRIGRGPVVAVLLFAGVLLPALGFFDVYPMRYSFVADHFQYLASAALLTLMAALGTVLVRRVVASPRLASALGVLVCALLAVLTLRQSRVYANPETLWRDTVVKNPGAWMAMNNLAYELQQQGRAREAVPYVKEAIRLNPVCFECYGNLADAYRAYGDEASATQVFADLGQLLLRQQGASGGQKPEPPGGDAAATAAE